MIENELDNYYFLYNNLLEIENNYMNNNTTITNSHRREDIITQILADKGEFKLNNDTSLFYEERKIVYLKIIVTKNTEKAETDNIEKTITLIRNAKQFKTKIELEDSEPKISFNIDINKENKIIICNENGLNVPFFTKKSGESDNCSDISNENKSTHSKSSNKSKKSRINNCFDYIFRDTSHEKDIYFITIKQKEHEIDGSLIANKTINDLKDILGNIIYYPKDIKSKPIKIVKDQKVFIEIKQNTTLLKLYEQMKKCIEDINEILPEENYLYLGFVNKDNALECFSKDDKNAQNELEENFIKDIETTIEKMKKFNICLLIIENNEFLGYSLEDRADYPIYYYNLISQQINAMETKINNKINTMETKINGIQKEIEGINFKINDIDSAMKQNLDVLKNNIFSRNNNFF